MREILIKNAKILMKNEGNFNEKCKNFNENKIFSGDVFLKDEKIEDIFLKKNGKYSKKNFSKDILEIDASGKYLIPGIIDTHVHFRDFKISEKGTIETESKAGIAGGVTSYIEMPNTDPPTVSIKSLNEKFQIASEKSWSNYSFYIGATDDNFDEILKINPKKICGVKVFLGSSTGNIIVKNKEILKKIFSLPFLIAVHCEDEEIIKKNEIFYKKKFGENIDIKYHSKIRSEEACFKSSFFAVEMAKKYNTRLHILHISTEKELELFENNIPSIDKKITSEVCLHHLFFDENDYFDKKGRIKLNPSIKTCKDKNALFNSVKNGKIDVISTDHAPHLSEEKENSYFKCPSGSPFIQHSLIAILEKYHKKEISLEKIVEKMAHAQSDIFNIYKRGYIKKGYFADLVLLDLSKKWKVNKKDILYKCAWSPLENEIFSSKVTHTFVNGNLIYENGNFYKKIKAKALVFKKS